MRSINAISHTSNVVDWLTDSRHPRILHVFDQVCNLVNEHRQVLSIVTSQVGNGPFNIVVTDEVAFSSHTNPQSEISVSPGRLSLGDLIVNTAPAKLWSPRPNWEELHARRESIFDQLIPFSSTVDEPLLPDALISRLSMAIARADFSSSHTIASKLAGLGMGLTPAGDDFIMGAVYAAWIIHPLEVASRLAWEIADTVAPLTTSLSAAWLRSAGMGEAGSVWHEFLDALLAESVEKHNRIQAGMEKILAAGETSGADALTGFFGTLIITD